MLREVPGSGALEGTQNGMECRREFLCDWDERFVVCPKPGQADPQYPLLTVKTFRIEGEGAPVVTGFGNEYELARIFITYTFEYNRPKLGDPPSITWTGEVEYLKTGIGYVWDDTGEVIEDSDITVAQPSWIDTCVIDAPVATFPKATLDGIRGKVNDFTFEGIEAGCLYFSDYRANAERDWDTEQWYWRLTITLVQKPQSWNLVWRPPVPDVDADGNLMRYQDKDAGAANYETDPAKVGRLVYKSGTSETGAWTTTTPKAFEEADFSVLLSLT